MCEESFGIPKPHTHTHTHTHTHGERWELRGFSTIKLIFKTGMNSYPCLVNNGDGIITCVVLVMKRRSHSEGKSKLTRQANYE